MKNPEEYLGEWMNNSSEDPFNDLCNSVKQAQKDAYNQAVSDIYERLELLGNTEGAESISEFEY